MICQKACPANKKFIKWIEDGAAFDQDETTLILDGVSEDHLPHATLEKLKKLGIMEYHPFLGRNLRALVDRSI